MTQFLRVRDERLCTSDIADAKYIVKEGPRTSYTILPPQNPNTNNLVYQLNNVGPNVGRNRQLWLNPQMTLTLSGTGITNPTATTAIGLKAWPFNRNVSQVQHTLNSSSETYLTNQIIDFLARQKTCAPYMQPYDNTQPDNCTDYLTNIANISPIGSYTSTILGDVQHPRNIGIISAVMSGGGTVLTVVLNWWEPLITPFSAVAENVKNIPALYGIDGETININFQSNSFGALGDLLCFNPGLGTFTGQVVSNFSCNMYIEYITARDLILPEVSLYQFPKYQRFTSNVPNASPNLAPTTGSNYGQVTIQVNAQTMPSLFCCYIRSTEATRTPTLPDSYVTITGAQIQLDNGTTLLNGASQRKLYDISRQNGLTDVYPVWNQSNLAASVPGSTPYYGAGSVFFVSPAKDLSISQEEGLTNCSAGKYTMQITLYFQNAVTINNAMAYVYTINDAVLIRQGRSYVTKLLAYSKEEVMNAQRDANFIEMQEYEEAKMNNLFLSGGSFKSFFRKQWNNRHKIVSHAKDDFKLGKEAYGLYKNVKGGYSLGGDMKMYYD